MIDIATFEAYLKELENKYKPGTKIRSNKYEKIDGQELKGKQILEIPASNRSFSQIQEYIDLAKNKYGIKYGSERNNNAVTIRNQSGIREH